MLLLNRVGNITEAWFAKADPTAREVSRVSSFAEGDSYLLLSCFIHLLLRGAGARAVLAKISSSPPLLTQHSSLSPLFGSFMKSLCRLKATS